MPAVTDETQTMTKREIHEVLFGLLSALFVALLSTTIVSTALPRIMGALEGTQTQYTWVVTASLLAMTVSGPIWSKLADLFSKKLLVQISIVVFVIGALLAGAVQNVPQLLVARAIQGLGMGGLIALAQAILGTIIPPRERGRYSGYLSATMAVATLSGPLLGGLIVDSVGWRWCFWVAAPFAVVGMAMLQRFLHLPTYPRRVRIDYFGVLFIAIAASLPLIWISFAGTRYAWWSTETAYFAAGTFAALVAAIYVERRHVEPVVPGHIVGKRITQLAVIGSIAIGIGQFGASVFLAEYFQIGRGYSPTKAGLLMLPLIVGSLIGSTGGGQYVSRTGKWKGLMLCSAAVFIVGMGLLGLTDYGTPLAQLSFFMVLVGLGMGGLMQNLVLVVQNSVDVTEVGAASGVVTFFRSLGGAMGVAVLGAILATRANNQIASSMQSEGAQFPAQHSSGGSLDLTGLPDGVVHLIRSAYADAIGHVFLIAAGVALLTFIAIAFMPVTNLRTTIRKEDEEQAQTEAFSA